MNTSKAMTKEAARLLRAAARLSEAGGRRRTMAPIRRRAIQALGHLARALRIVEEWEQGRARFARKRGLGRRANRTLVGLAVEANRRTKP